MKRVLWWGSLVAVNGAAMMGMILVRCDCGGPDYMQLLRRFAQEGSLFAGLFA